MLLEAAEGKRRPMIELFVDDTTPDEVWRAAIKTVKTGGGQPAFYNPNVLLPGIEKRFPIREGDIRNLCGGGCTEMMLSGLSNVGSLDAGINLPLILEGITKNVLPTAKSFDEFYSAYIDEARQVTEKVKLEINNSRREREKYNPLPMRTLLMDDCIDNGRDYNAGGARYNWSIINFAGMINVIDALLAIKTLVFDEKKYSAEELISKLDCGDEAFISEVRALPKSFGKDDAEVNEFAHNLSKTIFSFTENTELYEGLGFLSSSIQFMSQVGAGKNVGATADGRRCGEPLCDSLAAIFGRDTKGPTALLNSVTALDLKSALGTPVVNFNIQKSFDDNILRALIMGYMKRGGVQLQISCVSREDLLDAVEHPELHGNLVVRVGGYSEYFTRLSPELQKMVIDRTIQSEI
jgi:formate C-acetyltransferase